MLVVGPLHPSAHVGLAADLAAARALGVEAAPVCTALVAAGAGRVIDALEVPSDSVRAQLEHVLATSAVRGARVGALGHPAAVDVVFGALDALDGPLVLDFVASGSSGETMLDGRGIERLTERMSRADLVIFSRRDAELIGGGAVESLDDAQVAVQRLHRRGARRIVVRAGSLPARFFSPADDPGGDGAPAASECDLYFDGESFALFEAPHIPGAPAEGAAGAFSVAAAAALMAGSDFEDALRAAKAFVTDAIRYGAERDGRRELAFEAAAGVR